jgi:hypothetical protein
MTDLEIVRVGPGFIVVPARLPDHSNPKPPRRREARAVTREPTAA